MKMLQKLFIMVSNANREQIYALFNILGPILQGIVNNYDFDLCIEYRNLLGCQHFLIPKGE